MQTAGSPAAIVAAVDVGSNTIKMTVARQSSDDLIELLTDAQTVRLSAGLEQSGRIGPARAERALTCLGAFADEARRAGATCFIGVATETFRVAENGQELLARIAAETPWRLAVITGDEEARLTYAGAQPALTGAATAVVADVGGGSTELIAAQGDRATDFRSVPLGSGRLTDRYVTTDPPTKAALAACRDTATDMIRASTFTAPAPLERLLVTGGTGLYLAALIGGDTRVEPTRLAMAQRALLWLPSTAISETLHMPLERAKVLPAGLATVEAMVALWAPRELQMTASGIRRGLLLRYFAGDWPIE